ncbi:MAG: hypothetical protein M3519_08350 [Actinomycetota bacterium]|nr:hypothetical protein [Actinomycetota bacterium]
MTIWNGSVSGGTAASALERLDGFIPQAPDFVLLNIGHDQTVVDFADEADAARRARGAVRGHTRADDAAEPPAG